jgi:hypothetical protein
LNLTRFPRLESASLLHCGVQHVVGLPAEGRLHTLILRGNLLTSLPTELVGAPLVVESASSPAVRLRHVDLSDNVLGAGGAGRSLEEIVAMVLATGGCTTDSRHGHAASMACVALPALEYLDLSRNRRPARGDRGDTSLLRTLEEDVEAARAEADDDERAGQGAKKDTHVTTLFCRHNHDDDDRQEGDPGAHHRRRLRLARLRYVNLSHNGLRMALGPMAGWKDVAPELRSLDLSHNRLENTVHGRWCIAARSGEADDGSSSHPTRWWSAIKKFVAFSPPSRTDDDSHGRLPAWWHFEGLPPLLTRLDLSRNRLHVPHHLGSLRGLPQEMEAFDVSDNCLGGRCDGGDGSDGGLGGGVAAVDDFEDAPMNMRHIRV